MFAYKKPVLKKCNLCGKRIFVRHSGEYYCQSCSHFIRRMHSLGLTEKAKKSIHKYVKKFSFICAYSGVNLELKDYTSPWYCNYNFPDKRNLNIAVLSAAVFTVMKARLTKTEFCYYVLQLYNNRIKHTKFKKRPIVHWKLLDPNGCCICGQPKISTKSHYCVTCAHAAHRMHMLRLPTTTREVIWGYIRKYGYVCYYTGMKLDITDPHSPWYLSFDHCTPRDPKKVVITSILINEMKNELSEKEFWYYIAQLANHFRKGTPVRKIKLKYWSRQYIPS